MAGFTYIDTPAPTLRATINPGPTWSGMQMEAEDYILFWGNTELGYDPAFQAIRPSRNGFEVGPALTTVITPLARSARYVGNNLFVIPRMISGGWIEVWTVAVDPSSLEVSVVSGPVAFTVPSGSNWKNVAALVNVAAREVVTIRATSLSPYLFDWEKISFSATGALSSPVNIPGGEWNLPGNIGGFPTVYLSDTKYLTSIGNTGEVLLIDVGNLTAPATWIPFPDGMNRALVDDNVSLTNLHNGPQEAAVEPNYWPGYTFGQINTGITLYRVKATSTEVVAEARMKPNEVVPELQGHAIYPLSMGLARDDNQTLVVELEVYEANHYDSPVISHDFVYDPMGVPQYVPGYPRIDAVTAKQGLYPWDGGWFLAIKVDGVLTLRYYFPDEPITGKLLGARRRFWGRGQ